MKLYVGGCFQGKCELACKENQIASVQVFAGSTGNLEEIEQFSVINEVHQIVKRLLYEWEKQNLLAETAREYIFYFFAAYLEKQPEAILICDEIGNGVVPMEKEDRIWREETGRLLEYLASRAEQVNRVLCGLSMRMK